MSPALSKSSERAVDIGMTGPHHPHHLNHQHIKHYQVKIKISEMVYVFSLYPYKYQNFFKLVIYICFQDLHHQAMSRQNNYTSGPDQRQMYQHLSTDGNSSPRKVITSSTTTLPSMSTAISCSTSSRQELSGRRFDMS